MIARTIAKSRLFVRRWIRWDDDRFLCSNCGYQTRGLGRRPTCPECGGRRKPYPRSAHRAERWVPFITLNALLAIGVLVIAYSLEGSLLNKRAYPIAASCFGAVSLACTLAAARTWRRHLRTRGDWNWIRRSTAASISVCGTIILLILFEYFLPRLA
ncbi:MAG: hypothetical protein ACF8Q5_08100 [Phycisphaerales bacterium JB040]